MRFFQSIPWLHPSVNVSCKSLKIECCCETFKQELTKKAEVLIGKSVEKEISDSILKMFK